MRFRSKQTEIVYAGDTILRVGQHFAQDTFVRAREYTSSTRAGVGAASPLVVNYGNAAGPVSFSVCMDFATPDEAFAELLRRQAHTDAHQKGELVLTTGSVRTAQQVGCTRCEGVISFPGKGVRLTVSYDFCG